MSFDHFFSISHILQQLADDDDHGSSPHRLAARIFGAVGCSRLRAENTSWSDRGKSADPTQPLIQALTLTLTLILALDQKRARNGRATRLRRLWKFIYYSDLRTTT